MATLLSCPSSFSSPKSIGRVPSPFSFTQDQGTWVYCNYPEQICNTSQFGDFGLGNVYLNKVTINGSSQLFASHLNTYGNTFNYGVQLYNPNASNVTVTIQNNGFRSGSNSSPLSVECGVWSDFFATPGGNQYTLTSGQSMWVIVDKLIYNNYLFNAVMRFQTTGPLYCIEYVYNSRSNINGLAGLYGWQATDPCVGGQTKVYRGYGNSYFVASNAITLNVSQMPYTFYTNLCGDTTSGSDIINIYDPSGLEFYCTEGIPYNNLGNWGAQYYFTVSVHNDTPSNASIQAYVGTDLTYGSTGSAPSVMNLNGSVVYCGPGTNQMWQWLEEDTIGSGSTYQYTYQFIHAANASGPTRHDWRANGL